MPDDERAGTRIEDGGYEQDDNFLHIIVFDFIVLDYIRMSSWVFLSQISNSIGLRQLRLSKAKVDIYLERISVL